jgi:transposase
MCYHCDNEATIKRFLKSLANKERLCFVMEATGGYEKALVSFLLTHQCLF